MSEIKSTEEAIKRLEYLFQASNHQDDELKSYIIQLNASNEALKLTLHKLRTAQASKSNTISSMHSKLTDALRE